MINNQLVLIIKIFRFLLSYYLISILCISSAEPKKPNNSINILDIIQLENIAKKEFIEKKELNDINYDLYRMRSSNIKDRISLAQDPKGYFVNKHNNMFCFPEIDKKCKVNSPLYVYGDIKTNNLLSENVYTNSEQINLFSEVIRNIVNPFPSNIALEMLVASDDEKALARNQSALAENYVSQARLGISRNSFNTMLFNRLPLSYLTRSGSMDDKEKDKSELAKKDDISKLSIMAEQVGSRFSNAAWLEFVDKANNETLSKELVKMLAFHMWIEFEKFKQQERIESLLATMVAQQETTNVLMQSNAKKH